MIKPLKHIRTEPMLLIFLFLYLGIIYFSIALSNIFMGLGIFTFLAGWFRKDLDMDFQRKNIILYLVLVLPFVLTLVSVLHSEDTSAGMRSVWLRLPLLIIPFILIFTNFKTLYIKKAFYVFSSLSVLAVVLTLIKSVRYFKEGMLFQPDFAHFITPIQHPYFGIYLLIAFVSVIEFNLFPKKWLRTVILLILVAGILISTSRLAYLFLFFILLIYGFQFLNKKKRIVFTLVLLIFSILFIGLNKGVQAKFSNSLSYQESPRLKLWNNAIKVVNRSENKFLGIGIGDYYHKKNDPYFFKDSNIGLFGYDPHNQFMEFFITTGYLGITLILVSMLFLVFYIRNQNRFAFLIFMIISLFTLTESILNRQYGVELYSVLLPLIFKSNFKK